MAAAWGQKELELAGAIVRSCPRMSEGKCVLGGGGGECWGLCENARGAGALMKMSSQRGLLPRNCRRKSNKDNANA
jgi:hypothetical protein